MLPIGKMAGRCDVTLVFGDMSIHTSAGRVRKGVGGYADCNKACQQALEKMESTGLEGVSGSFNRYELSICRGKGGAR